MRRFFVYFLLLGVLTTTALLTWAQLPQWVQQHYSEDDYFSSKARLAGGSLEDSLKNAAKQEVMLQIFHNAKILLNWAQADYSLTLDNLEKMRLDKSHLAKLMNEKRDAEWVHVNIEKSEAKRAYLDMQKDLKRQINGLLANAAQMEVANPKQALQAYLQTYPLYEQLKEATLLELATGLYQDPTPEIAKLMEVARGTSGGELDMSFPDVTQRVNQIQNEGRLMQNVQQIGNSIAQQLSVQTRGMKKGKVTLSGFNYKNSRQQAAVSNELVETLIKLLQADGWTVVPPTRGFLSAEVSIIMKGVFREGGAGLQCQVTAYNVDTGQVVGNSVVDLDPGLDTQIRPQNYVSLQKSIAEPGVELTVHGNLFKPELPEMVGSWEMVSIDGKPVTEHLWQTVSIDDKPFMEYLWERVQLSDKSVAELLGGELSSIETKVTQNDFVLFENGSWFWTFGLNMEADLGGGVSLIPTMSLANRGSYTPLPEDSDGTTTNFVREVIKIHLEPEDFWETAAVEVSEEDIREAITRDWLFGKVENWEGRFDGNTLTLTNTEGIKLVLKRKDPPKPDLDRTPQAKNTWVSVPEGDPLESILKDPRQELQLKMSKNANSPLNSRAWDTVTDGSKRLEELQRLKAEAEAELKHVERLQRLKVEIIEELTRLEELQRLKMQMAEELELNEGVKDAKKEELITTMFKDAQKLLNPKQESFDGIYKREGFIRTGTDYALLFATDAYTHRANLSSPIADAEAIGAELANRYGFKVDLRKNVQRTEILNTLVEYAEKSYQPGDQLFIYFAGNGNFSEALNDGYIAASDSKLPEEDPSHATYLSYARLRQDLDSIACERVMLVLDVCYGGTFDDNSNALIEGPVTRGAREVMKPILDLNQTLKVKTRWYLSSGGKEEVSDGVGGHSPFALSLLTVLRDGAGPDGVLTIPEIERQLPIKLREELDKIEVVFKYHKFQQTPVSGPFGSGKAADKAFVFIGKDFVPLPPPTR